MTKKVLPLLLFFILLVTVFTVLAQPGLPNTPTQSPVGGLALLAVGGGAYAIKKLRAQNKS